MERVGELNAPKNHRNLSLFLCLSAFVLPVAAETRTYTVRNGDTVYLITKRFGLTTQQLIAMNGLEAPYEIYPGQVLVLGMEEGPEARRLRRRRAAGCSGSTGAM